eukprot:TRINITY_DN144_c0_g1_i3.p1 TRINITY_DN144_c0_g1~~TRINITY_DN144_c0_g1_i3.p1  ORF type:complete len:281 (-),score=22.20 TRINITY_DN144_c0_g1_i3:168-1010(-)
MDSIFRDSFSRLPQELLKIIFDFSSLGTKLSLSQTCSRFHSLPWIDSLLKTSCLKRLEELTGFLPEIFVFGLQEMGIGWKYVAHCISKPVEERKYYLGLYHEQPYLLIGKIGLDPSEIQSDLEIIIERIPGVIVITPNFVRTFHHLACIDLQENNSYTRFSGKIILRDADSQGDSRLTLQGLMKWPDGYHHSGKWQCFTSWSFDFVLPYMISFEKPIHPKIKQFMDEKICTNSSNVIGPQLFAHGRLGSFCHPCSQHCNIWYGSLWTSSMKCDCIKCNGI